MSRLFGRIGKDMMRGIRTASEDDLIATLKDLFGEIVNPTYLILDALDECTQISGLMSLLRLIHDWGCANLRLLVLSRKEKVIEDALNSLMPFQVDLNEMVNEDIEMYIENQLSASHHLLRWTRMPEVRRHIERTLLTGANGMWVYI
jgi:hypothetical protein